MSQKREDNAAVNRHTVRRLLRYAKPYIGWFLLVLVIIVCIIEFVGGRVVKKNTH